MANRQISQASNEGRPGNIVGQPLRMPGGPPVNPPGAPFTRISRAGNSFPSSGVPGLRVSVPGNGLVRSTSKNKSGASSNELVVFTYITSHWPGLQFEKTQTGGSAMFVQRKGGALTVAQMNILLRLGYTVLKSQNTTEKKTGLSLNGVPVTGELQNLKPHIDRYEIEGENAITGEEGLMDKINTDRIFSKLVYLTPEAITDNFNYIGMLTQKGEPSRGGIVLNIGHKGPTSATQLQNYWGSVREGELLFFILKGAEQPAAGKPNWKQYPRLEAWHGYHEPGERELRYEDVAGISQRGIAIYVGSVIFPPMMTTDYGHRLKMIGLTADAHEAHSTSVENRSVITANIGNPRHNLQKRVA